MVVYLTTNLLTGKKYIGMDTRNNPKYLGSGKDLVADIKKLGKENFKKEILEVCFSKEELIDREIYWIKYYDAKNKDDYYNLIDTKTPVQKEHLTQEHKDKIGLANTGKIRSKEIKEHWSKVRKGKSKGPHPEDVKIKISKGNQKPKPEGHGKKVSLAKKGKPVLNKRVKILKINKETKKVMKIYEGIKTVAEDGFNPSAVQGCCTRNRNNGKEYTSGGFIWKYLKKEETK